MMWYPSSLSLLLLLSFFGGGVGAFLPFLSVALVGRKVNDR